MAAVIVLLAGAILWGVFGHIRTTAQVAVSITGESSLCYVPYSVIDGVMEQGVVTVDGRDYPLDTDAECDMDFIAEDAPIGLRQAGNLHAGDLVIMVPIETDLAEGYYAGVAVTEDLQPISLLLQ